MWEILPGSMYLCYANPGPCVDVAEKIKRKNSTSFEDTEKDLHRSLSEYAGYQSEEGIDVL